MKPSGEHWLDRAELETREELYLAPWAMKAARAGRLSPIENLSASFDYRTAFQRDRDRIIHSRAFRRLKDKTQVHMAVGAGSDHVRTRLTHTLEVSQVSRTIARALRLNEDLTEAIALGHDLGHTPFGHAGESALNAILSGKSGLALKGFRKAVDAGGFKHNYQTLRVVDSLEVRYDHPGLNLTNEVREGLLKHTSLRKDDAPPGVETRGLHLERAPFLEAQVVHLVDDLVQQVHDLDDGLARGDLSLEQAIGLPIAREVIANIGDQWNASPTYARRNLLIRGMLHLFATGIIVQADRRIREWAAEHEIADTMAYYKSLDKLDWALVTLPANLKPHYKTLRERVYGAIINSYEVNRSDAKAQRVLEALFLAYYDNPHILENYVLLRFRDLTGRPYLRDVPLNAVDKEIAQHYHGSAAFLRVVADFIAGMTDRYALQEYERIHGTIQHLY